MKTVWILWACFFSSAAFALSDAPYYLDLEVAIEGRQFSFKDLLLKPGRSVSLLKRAEKMDSRSYSFDLKAEPKGKDTLVVTLGIGQNERGRFRSLEETQIIGKIGQSVEVKGMGKNVTSIKLAILPPAL